MTAYAVTDGLADRVAKAAKEAGKTPEQWVHAAIGKELGFLEDNAYRHMLANETPAERTARVQRQRA